MTDKHNPDLDPLFDDPSLLNEASVESAISDNPVAESDSGMNPEPFAETIGGIPLSAYDNMVSQPDEQDFELQQNFMNEINSEYFMADPNQNETVNADHSSLSDSDEVDDELASELNGNMSSDEEEFSEEEMAEMARHYESLEQSEVSNSDEADSLVDPDAIDDDIEEFNAEEIALFNSSMAAMESGNNDLDNGAEEFFSSEDLEGNVDEPEVSASATDADETVDVVDEPITDNESVVENKVDESIDKESKTESASSPDAELDVDSADVPDGPIDDIPAYLDSIRNEHGVIDIDNIMVPVEKADGTYIYYKDLVALHFIPSALRDTLNIEHLEFVNDFIFEEKKLHRKFEEEQEAIREKELRANLVTSKKNDSTENQKVKGDLSENAEAKSDAPTDEAPSPIANDFSFNIPSFVDGDGPEIVAKNMAEDDLSTDEELRSEMAEAINDKELKSESADVIDGNEITADDVSTTDEIDSSSGFIGPDVPGLKMPDGFDSDDVSSLSEEEREAVAKRRAELQDRIVKGLRDGMSTDSEYEELPVVAFQKYLMVLQELAKEENQFLFMNFVSRLTDQVGIADLDATAKELAQVDVAAGQLNLKLIQEIAPEVVDAVESHIRDNYDAWSAFEEAGFEFNRSSGAIPMGFMEDVQVMMAFDDAFPDENRPSIVERLKANKDRLLEAVNSDNGQLALSTAAFSIACIAGSAAFPVAGALYAANLMKNGKIQDLANTVHKRISDNLVRMGFREESVKGRERYLGDMMKGIMDSKWGQSAVIGLSACAIGFGLYSVLESSNMSLDGAKNVIADVKTAIFDGVDAAKAMIENGTLPDFPSVSEATASIKGMFGEAMTAGKSWFSNMFGSEGVLTTGLESAAKSVETTVSSAVDTAKEAVKSAAQSTNETVQSVTEAGSEAAQAGAEASIASTTYSVPEKGTLWSIAKEHYMATVGEKASPQQIIAMINDLGLENPNLVKEGQEVVFSNDLSKYQDVAKVSADWLDAAKDASGALSSSAEQLKVVAETKENVDWILNAQEATSVAARMAEGAVINTGMVDIGSMYDIRSIKGSLPANFNMEFASINEDIDFFNLSPGDEVKFLNGDVYVVPDLDDAVAKAVFPSGIPEYVDKGKLLDLIQESNEGINLDEGWFGVQSLFGNPNLGAELASNGVIYVPEVDLSALNPDVTGNVNIHGMGNDAFSIDRAILNAAYPDGVPKLLDQADFLERVEEANPGLYQTNGEHFNLSIVIPDVGYGTPAPMTIAQASDVAQVNVSEESKSAISRFLDRFRSSDLGLS